MQTLSPIAAAAELRALFDQGHLDEAEQYVQELISQHPGIAFFPNALGNICKERGDLDGALVAYRTAAAVDPTFAEAWINAGHITIAHLQFAEALDCFARALTLQPESPDAWFGRARSLQLRGDFADAEAAYKKAIELKPDFMLAHNNLGCLYQERPQLVESETHLRRALELDPQHVEALQNLAVTLGKRGRHSEAEEYCRAALALKPEDYASHNNLAKILSDCGDYAAALPSYREALRLEPGCLSVHSNLLFTLHYAENIDERALYDEALRYGNEAAGLAPQPYTQWRRNADTARLRVGFVSGDLMQHPVGYFVENVLRYLDPARVELVAFPTRSREDALTEGIKPCFADWLPLHALDDAAAAKCVHDAAIDVLVDLSGHTAHNRLGVFAYKPAPVQVSWLGYFATTGLATMDRLLADHAGVPPDQQRWFTEKLEYLPDTRLCFTPPDFALEPNALPALTQRAVTFGCFQKLAKITDRVLAVWARILTEVPHGRLLLQCQALNDPRVAEAFRERLRAAGMDPARVRLQPQVEREAYLRQHHIVDFLLDTFPYPGGTTTCEALWMGVPTLTLAGASLLARQGVSILTAAGLPEWIAGDEDDYVRKARAFAFDLPALARLRDNLRAQVLASPLFDAKRFAGNLESALLRMWREYLNASS